MLERKATKIKRANRELFEDRMISVLDRIAVALEDIGESQTRIAEDAYKTRMEQWASSTRT